MDSSRNNHSSFLRIRAYALLFCFPAFAAGCLAVLPSANDVTAGQTALIHATTKSIDYGTVRETDIFVFNDDALGRLESYQRTAVDPEGEYAVDIASAKGRKRVVMIANSNRDRTAWNGIRSYEGLQKATARLQDEDMSFPTMYGETVFTAGDGNPHRITLRPIVSEIHLRTLRCDFSGTEYEYEKMKNVRVYLTNINSECRIMQENVFRPISTVNTGGLSHEDMGTFRHPEIIYAETGTDIGYGIFDSAIRLYCYPNESTEETPGTPFTRLVIEGEICGRTWYYPISINRKDGNCGIGRNCSYIYNITIRRAGSSDPDCPVGAEAITADCQIIPWEERNEEEITF